MNQAGGYFCIHSKTPPCSETHLNSVEPSFMTKQRLFVDCTWRKLIFMSWSVSQVVRHTHTELQWKIFSTTAAGRLATLWRQTEFPSHSCVCDWKCVFCVRGETPVNPLFGCVFESLLQLQNWAQWFHWGSPVAFTELLICFICISWVLFVWAESD